MSQLHVMIDIEAFGQDFPVQLGLVAFTKDRTYEELELKIEPTTVHGTPDVNTIMWWLQQGETARERVYNRNGQVSLKTAAKALKAYWENVEAKNLDMGYKRTLLWSHATFDPVVLERGLRASGFAPPWSFRDCRDLRTLYGLDPDVTALAYRSWSNAHGMGGDHTAIADAKKQVYVWQNVVQALNLNPR